MTREFRSICLLLAIKIKDTTMKTTHYRPARYGNLCGATMTIRSKRFKHHIVEVPSRISFMERTHEERQKIPGSEYFVDSQVSSGKGSTNVEKVDCEDCLIGMKVLITKRLNEF